MGITVSIIVFSVFVLFYFFMHPIWSLVDCARSERLSKGWKAFWVIFIVFFWCLGSLCYGIAGASSPKLKKISIYFFPFILILTLIWILLAK